MAITKIHAIHKTIEKTVDYVLNEQKTDVTKIDKSYSDSLHYIANPNKTDNSILVSGINCDPETAIEEMALTREKWESKAKQNGTNLGYHIIQSFDPKDNVDYKTAHEIGIKLAESLGGKYQTVVATHIDKEHIHNHIVVCAWDIETGKKYKRTTEGYLKIRKTSDDLCKQYGASIIENPHDKGLNYKEWLERKNNTSWKAITQNDISKVMKITDNWKDFIRIMESMGYTIKETESFVTYKAAEAKRGVRDKTLGESFTKEAITSYWNTQRQEPEPSSKPPTIPAPSEVMKAKEKIRQEEDDKTYFYNPKWISSKTKKPYKVLRNGEDGHKRSIIELIAYLAMVIIKGEEETRKEKIKEPLPPMNSSAKKNQSFSDEPRLQTFAPAQAVYAKQNWKLQNMLDTIKVAREENIENISEVEENVARAGRKYGGIKRQLEKNQATYNKMINICNAIERLEEVESIALSIKALPQGEKKEAAIKAHSEEISEYRKYSALLHRSNIHNKSDRESFKERFTSIEEKIAETTKRLEGAKEEYRKLKKLQYNLDLARYDSFCYGYNYNYEKALHDEDKKRDEPQQPTEKSAKQSKEDYDR